MKVAVSIRFRVNIEQAVPLKKWSVDGQLTTYQPPILYQPPKILSCRGEFHVVFFIHRCFLGYDNKMPYKLEYKSR